MARISFGKNMTVLIKFIPIVVVLLSVQVSPAAIMKIVAVPSSTTTTKSDRNLKEYEQVYPGETLDLTGVDWKDMNKSSQSNNIGATLDLTGDGWTDMTNYTNLQNNIIDVTTGGMMTEFSGLGSSPETRVMTDVDIPVYESTTPVINSKTPASDLQAPVINSQTPAFNLTATTASYVQLGRGVKAKHSEKHKKKSIGTIHTTTRRKQSDVTDKNVDQTKKDILDLSSTVQPDTSTVRDEGEKTLSMLVDKESTSQSPTADSTSLASLKIFTMVLCFVSCGVIVGVLAYNYKPRPRDGQPNVEGRTQSDALKSLLVERT